MCVIVHTTSMRTGLRIYFMQDFLTRNGVHTIQSSDASIKRGVSNHINGRRARFIAVRTARRNELVGASVSQKREYSCLSENKTVVCGIVLKYI